MSSPNPLPYASTTSVTVTSYASYTLSTAVSPVCGQNLLQTTQMRPTTSVVNDENHSLSGGMPRPLAQILLCVLGSRWYRVIQLVKLRIVLPRIKAERNKIYHYGSLAHRMRRFLSGNTGSRYRPLADPCSSQDFVFGQSRIELYNYPPLWRTLL